MGKNYEQTPCEKCYGGYYGKPKYQDDAIPSYYAEALVYTCDKCGHKIISSTKATDSQAKTPDYLRNTTPLASYSEKKGSK